MSAVKGGVMRRTRWAGATLLLVVAVSFAEHRVARAGCSDTGTAALERVEGRLIGLASSVRSEPGRPPGPPILTFLVQTPDGPLTVTLTDATLVHAADGRSIAPASIPPGTLLAIEGERTEPAAIVAVSIVALP